MSIWILNNKGEVVSRPSLRFLIEFEMASETGKGKMNVFIISVNKKLVVLFYEIGIQLDSWGFFSNGETSCFTPYVGKDKIEELNITEADAITDYDKFTESEVLLPKNGVQMSTTRFFRCSRISMMK